TGSTVPTLRCWRSRPIPDRSACRLREGAQHRRLPFPGPGTRTSMWPLRENIQRSQPIDATPGYLGGKPIGGEMEHGGLGKRADELWARWKKGETASQIARAFGANPGSVGKLLAKHGGIAPPPRRRSSRVL